MRAADGSYTRVPILNAAGKKLKGFNYLPFNVAQIQLRVLVLPAHL